MKYEDVELLKNNNLAGIIRAICIIYEQKRHENFLKWVEEYPEYWKAFCRMDMEEITPNFAEEVMETLIASNLVDLQVAWLFKCGDNLDITGKAINENKEET